MVTDVFEVNLDAVSFLAVKSNMAVKVALVYPYFHPANDNSIFRFPPLGLGYIAE